jgi:putative tricarboxylic transport membrane protein
VKLSRDGWAGLVVLAVSLVLFALTLGLTKSELVPIGPAFYPRIVLGITAVLAVLLVAFDFFDKNKLAKKEGHPHYGAVVLNFALFGLYVGLMPGVGFRIATFAYVAAANAFMAPPARASGWLRVALIALGTVVVTYVVFDLYLTVLLPRGRWTGW